MNIGSVSVETISPTAVSGNAVQTSGNRGGIFGSVLAGMTKSVETANTAASSNQLGSATETISDILSATTISDLASALEELTEIPQEDILNNLGTLGQASPIEEWANALEIDPAKLMETISSLLEEAGVSKEELAEVMYSNDLWTLLNAVNEYAPKLSSTLEGMLNSKDQPSQKQATNLLALLKTVEMVLPTKDLLGWQQTSLTQLSEQLKGLQQFVEPKVANEEVKFAALITTQVPQSVQLPQTAQNETLGVIDVEPKLVQVAPVIETIKSIKLETEQSLTRSVIQAMPVVTENSQEQAPNEGESEQNHSQLLNNTSVQPIVSKNVFSLETPEARPTSQSEALLEKLQGLFKQTNFGQQGGTNRLLVKLNPEQLGQIRIELIQINGVMTARILASTALGKEMLDSQLHQLRQSFNQQNIQVDRIDVTQAVQDPSRNDRSQNFNHQQFKGNADQQEQQEHEHEEQQTFQEYLLDVEV